jgi:hypothetical protein
MYVTSRFGGWARAVCGEGAAAALNTGIFISRIL